jgi:D-beta-D-heptose 7-phosphate kinase/D-beta-D-heptose 1-phosphate adenosyltransferase
MQHYEEILSRLGEQTVLCVGDLMLDEFIYGDVTRISPEAATPVLAVRRQETEIGGAGNVARNIASLGARCVFVGVVGDDDAGRALAKSFHAQPNIDARLVVDGSRSTTRKVRFVSEHHSTHLLRADWEAAGALDAKTEAEIIEHVRAALPLAGAVVLSDYAKGVLTPKIVRTLIDAARTAGKPVVVDPKGHDYSVYRGATLITPNLKEVAEATRRAAKTDDEVGAAAADLAETVGSEAVIVTRSEDGMTLLVRGAPAIHVAAYPVRVRDMSGAGDTVAATLGALLAMGEDFETAMRAANAAASVVVGKRGTATCSAPELRARIIPHAVLATEEKVFFDHVAATESVDEWRRKGLRIGFTNGCFDLLHPGHVRLLTEARSVCDRLVVGLNSDGSVAGLKGPGRPIQNQQARAEVLAALEAVDLVVIFEEATPIELIRRLRPKVLVKGADYRLDEVVGREVVEAEGGEVVLVDLVPGHSTTDLVEQSRRQQQR